MKSLLFCFLSLALAGCLGDNVHPQNGSLGTQYTEATVEAAVTAATSGISITNAQVGDCATYEFNSRINEDPVLMYQMIKHKLMSITQATGSTTYNLFEDSYSYDPSGALSSQVHRQLPIEFTTQPQPPSTWQNCAGQVTNDGDGINYDCIQYYNLKTDDELVAAPTAIQQKPNCLGFANCQIPVHHIIYDQVKFLKGQQVNKVNIEADYSSAIPDLLYVQNSDGSISYYGAATSLCLAQIVTGGPDNSNYLQRQCVVLQDLNHGTTGDCSPPTP